MLHIPKIDDYFDDRFMTDEEVKDFVAINFIEYFKSTRRTKSLKSFQIALYLFNNT